MGRIALIAFVVVASGLSLAARFLPWWDERGSPLVAGGGLIEPNEILGGPRLIGAPATGSVRVHPSGSPQSRPSKS